MDANTAARAVPLTHHGDIQGIWANLKLVMLKKETLYLFSFD